jgi:molybdopterin converting factor small subunit
LLVIVVNKIKKMSGNTIENVLNEVVGDVLDEVKTQIGKIEDLCDEIPYVDSEYFEYGDIYCDNFGCLCDLINDEMSKSVEDAVDNFCTSYNGDIQDLRKKFNDSYEKLNEKIQNLLPTLTKKLSNIKMVVSENEIIKDLQKQLKEKDEMVKRLKRKVVEDESWSYEESRTKRDNQYEFEGRVSKFLGHHKFMLELDLAPHEEQKGDFATMEERDDGWYFVWYMNTGDEVECCYFGNVLEWIRWQKSPNYFGVYIRD